MQPLAASMRLIQNMSQTCWTGSGSLRLLAPADKAEHGKVQRDVQGRAFGAWGLWLFEDWLAIDRSREVYIRIRDGLVLE